MNVISSCTRMYDTMFSSLIIAKFLPISFVYLIPTLSSNPFPVFFLLTILYYLYIKQPNIYQ